MNHLDVFLTAIHDEPDSDEPRLICADWLMDQGDSRGELMRLQVLRARLPADDLHWLALDRQEWGLLNRDVPCWLGPLWRPTICWEFVRGLPRLEVEADDFFTQPIETEDDRRAYAWVEQLTFRRFQPAHAGILARFPHLIHLRRVSFVESRLGDRGAATLAAAPHLARLAVLDLGDPGLGISESGRRRLLRSPLRKAVRPR